MRHSKIQIPATTRGYREVRHKYHTSNQESQDEGGEVLCSMKHEHVNDAMRSWTMMFFSTNTMHHTHGTGPHASCTAVRMRRMPASVDCEGLRPADRSQ